MPGRAPVTEGALVSAAGAILLTTIEQPDPIHVLCTAPSTALLEHDRASRAGQLRAPRHCRATLPLPDGSRYERAGTIDLADQSVRWQRGAGECRDGVPYRSRVPPRVSAAWSIVRPVRGGAGPRRMVNGGRPGTRITARATSGLPAR